MKNSYSVLIWVSTVEQYYNLSIKDVTEEDIKNNFLLIPANHEFDFGNASETLRNRFVFYSPSITTGVDLRIYLHQSRSIDASSSFQQATQCRNIRKLLYYA